MSKTRRVLLTLLCLALLRPVTDALLAVMLPDMLVNPVPNCIAGAALSLLMLGLPARLLQPWRSERLPRQKQLWPGLAVGASGAVLVRAAMTVADAAWQGWLNIAPDALPAPESVPVAMLYIAALVILPAATEEAFFRGALLTGLLDGSRRATALLLTTAAFALLHGSLANLPSLLVLSALLTLLMLHTGHIAVPVTAHLVYNLTALMDLSLPAWGGGLCACALAVLCGWLLHRQPRMAHPPMRAADGLIAGAAVIIMMISTLI